MFRAGLDRWEEDGLGLVKGSDEHGSGCSTVVCNNPVPSLSFKHPAGYGCTCRRCVFAGRNKCIT
jgi:hypothetical protein